VGEVASVIKKPRPAAASTLPPMATQKLLKQVACRLDNVEWRIRPYHIEPVQGHGEEDRVHPSLDRYINWSEEKILL
jgi:hypothetical protein